ncbi:C40 family peptidase [Levilactobacillus enshiensis]|uniref:C40 family peptidase n=1 Tax=Levilactobacillus enshiensis TaxID=2590213 RepID=UPI00117B8925|nr:NlpC/P60 family protein [Levilactobacillus enshiensis]
MKIKQLSLAVAFAAAVVPVLNLSTTAQANSTNTILSTTPMTNTSYVRKSATGWTYNLGGTASNMTFGKKTHYLKNYPNTTWHATQKRYIVKKNGVKYLYYYVTNGRGTAAGWIWHGYLTPKSYAHTATTSTSTTGNGTYAAILSAAQAQLGKPYSYGGNGPSAFDCSGFTKYVFNKALGQTLPRTAQQQYDSYTHVSAANAKPGDLIFFGTSTANITHCGIYLGNHRMIDAQLNGVITEATNVSWWHAVGYSRPASLS